MKYGVRTPSVKKSISARTTGRAKRSFKRLVNPFYGKKGTGWLTNPKKAAYNKIYRKTTISAKGLTGCITACVYYPFYWTFMLMFYVAKLVLIAVVGAVVLLINGVIWLTEQIYNAARGADAPLEPEESASLPATPKPVKKKLRAVSLDNIQDRYTTRVPKILDCIQVHGFVRVPVSGVDREVLQRMVCENSYAVTPTLILGNTVVLMYDGVVVATLDDHVKLCREWLKSGDPIRCEMTGFQPSKEHVVLALYRNEEKHLVDHSNVIVKLTTYSAEAKQDCIAISTQGDLLTCAEDDNVDGKVNVLDWSGDPIGRLPKKYADLYMADGIAGIFFDHTEEDGNGKLAPFVKIYQS